MCSLQMHSAILWAASSLSDFFLCRILFSLMQSHLTIFVFVACAAGVLSKKLWSVSVSCHVSPHFPLVISWFQVLDLDPWSIMGWFLYRKYCGSRVLFLYFLISNFPICWRDCPFPGYNFSSLVTVSLQMHMLTSEISHLFHWSTYLFLWKYYTGL